MWGLFDTSVRQSACTSSDLLVKDNENHYQNGFSPHKQGVSNVFTQKIHTIAIVASTMAFFSCSSRADDENAKGATAAEMVAGFQTELKTLRALIADRKTNAAQIETAAVSLVAKGNPILKRISKIEKDCEPALSQVVADSVKMQSIPLAQIETDYHQGKVLPKTDNDLCYEVKEFVVHPATVTVLARTQAKKGGVLNQDTRDAMDAELAELAYHLDNVMAMTDGLSSSAAQAR